MDENVAICILGKFLERVLACVKYLANSTLCSNQETVLVEQFGKLTQNQQKKVTNDIIVIITIFTIIHNCNIVTSQQIVIIIITVEGDGFTLGGGGKPAGCCLQDKLHSRLSSNSKLSLK